MPRTTGGRQLDGVSSSITALPHVVKAIGGDADVLVDGGVRSGLDVFRARALGRGGVLIGRPWAYAVAARGEAGVRALVSAFQKELTVAMALCGVTSTGEIRRDLVQMPNRSSAAHAPLASLVPTPLGQIVLHARSLCLSAPFASLPYLARLFFLQNFTRDNHSADEERFEKLRKG